MTVEIIKLAANSTPKDFLAQRNDLTSMPDGVGLQIFFEVDGEYYLIAGPRAGGRVTAVNGGKIENADHSFYAQIAEELYEETFGLMRIESHDDGYVLVINNDSRHPLAMLEEQCALETNEQYHYSYVTFSAVCKTLKREQLDSIAAQLHPTANYWNQIGNYLFSHYRLANQGDGFEEYWRNEYVARDALIAEWVSEYQQLITSYEFLVDPLDVFEAKTIEDALHVIHKIANYEELCHVFHHTVGRYSERSGYHVFNANELMHAATAHSQVISDANGRVVASGLYYTDVIAAVFPSILPQHACSQKHPSLAALGLWSSQLSLPTDAKMSGQANSVQHHY